MARRQTKTGKQIRDADSLRKDAITKFARNALVTDDVSGLVALEQASKDHAALLYSMCINARYDSAKGVLEEDREARTRHREILHQCLRNLIDAKSTSVRSKLRLYKISYGNIENFKGGAAPDTALVCISAIAQAFQKSLLEVVNTYIKYCKQEKFIENNPAFKEGNVTYYEGMEFFAPPLKEPTDTDDGTEPKEKPEPLLPNPYKGLAPFGEQDQHIFFGRTALIQALADKISQQPFTAIYGASGSGKSSVMRAGVVPAMAKPERGWHAIVFRLSDAGEHSQGEPDSSHDPFWALACELTPLMYPEAGVERVDQRKDVHRRLQEDGASWLCACVEEIRTVKQCERILIVIDQFEELFTLAISQRDIAQFLGLLTEFCATLGVKGAQKTFALIITLRDGFLSDVNVHEPFSKLLKDSIEHVFPLDRGALKEAVREPAKIHAGHEVTFDDDVVERILEDAKLDGSQHVSGDRSAKPSGTLPLVEFVLQQLWDAKQGNRITLQDYYKVGGVSGALRKHADGRIKALSTEHEKGRAEHIFVALVGSRHGTYDTRRVLRLSAFSIEQKPLVHKLADEDHRLLVVQPGLNEAETTVEIVHEALIHHWDRLQEWLKDRRDYLDWCEGIIHRHQVWNDNGKKTEDLLSGSALTKARQYQHEYRNKVAPLGEEQWRFVEASIADMEAAEQIRKRKEARTHRNRSLAITLFAAATAAFLSLSVALKSALDEAESQTNAVIIERNRALASRGQLLAKQASEQLNSGNYRLAALVALEALDKRADSMPLSTDYAQDALSILRATLGNYFQVAQFQLPPDTQSIKINRADSVFAAERTNGDISLFDTTSGQEIFSIPGQEAEPSALLQFTKAKSLAVLYSNGRVTIYDSINGGKIRDVKVTDKPFTLYHLSSSGHYMALLMVDYGYILCDLYIDPSSIEDCDYLEGWDESFFSFDRNERALGVAAGVLKNWVPGVGAGDAETIYAGHVSRAILDTTKTYIWINPASSDSFYRSLEASSDHSRVIKLHPSETTRSTINWNLRPNGFDVDLLRKLVAFEGHEAERIFFDSENGAEIPDEGRMTREIYDPHSGRLISNRDGVVTIRDALSQKTIYSINLGEAITSIPGGVEIPSKVTSSIEYIDEDGGFAAFAGLAKSLIVFQQLNLPARKSLLVGGEGVASIGFSPDSRLLAIADHMGHIRFHDVATGRLRSVIRSVEVPDIYVGFRKGGSEYFTAELDRILSQWIISGWDVATGRRVLRANFDLSRLKGANFIGEGFHDHLSGLYISNDGRSVAIGIDSSLGGHDFYKISIPDQGYFNTEGLVLEVDNTEKVNLENLKQRLDFVAEFEAIDLHDPLEKLWRSSFSADSNVFEWNSYEGRRKNQSGKYFVKNDKSGFVVVNLSSGETILTLPDGLGASAFCYGFSLDNASLYIANFSGVTFWNLESGEQIREIEFDGTMTEAVYSNDDMSLFVRRTSSDLIEVYDVSNGELVFSESVVGKFVVSPDSMTAAWGGPNGQVTISPLSSPTDEDIIDYFKSATIVPLTPEEREDFGLSLQ